MRFLSQVCLTEISQAFPVACRRRVLVPTEGSAEQDRAAEQEERMDQMCMVTAVPVVAMEAVEGTPAMHWRTCRLRQVLAVCHTETSREIR